MSNGEKAEEELRTLKIAYDKMIQAKDQEIKEVEERLQENMSSAPSRVKVLKEKNASLYLNIKMYK